MLRVSTKKNPFLSYPSMSTKIDLISLILKWFFDLVAFLWSYLILGYLGVQSDLDKLSKNKQNTKNKSLVEI